MRQQLKVRWKKWESLDSHWRRKTIGRSHLPTCHKGKDSVTLGVVSNNRQRFKQKTFVRIDWSEWDDQVQSSWQSVFVRLWPMCVLGGLNIDRDFLFQRMRGSGRGCRLWDWGEGREKGDTMGKDFYKVDFDQKFKICKIVFLKSFFVISDIWPLKSFIASHDILSLYEPYNDFDNWWAERSTI